MVALTYVILATLVHLRIDSFIINIESKSKSNKYCDIFKF